MIGNCGFDTDITGWFVGDGTAYHDPVDGATAPGSLCIDAVDDGGTWIVLMGYCITSFSSATTYSGGITFRQTGGTTPTSNYVELSQRPQTNCGGVPTAVDLRNDVPISGSWSDSPNLTMTTTSTTGGLGLFVYFEDPAPFTICFDDGYIGIGLVPVELEALTVE